MVEEILYLLVSAILILPLIASIFLLFFNFNLSVLLSIFITLFILYFLGKKWNQKFRIEKSDVRSILVIIFFFLSISLIRIRHSFLIKDVIDHYIHILISQNIRKGGIPPEEPCIIGEKVRIPFFYHLLTAILSYIISLSSETIFLLLSFYSLTLNTLLFFLIGRRFLKKKYFIHLFIIFSQFLLLPYYSLPSPYSFSLILLFFNVYLLISNKILFSLLITTTSLFFHGFVFILNSILLFSFLTYTFLLRKVTKTLIKDFIVGMVLSFFLILFFAYLGLGPKDNRVFLFEPFSGIPSLIFFGPFFPFIFLTLVYIRRKDKDALLLYNFIFSLLVFSTSFLFRYGGDLPKRFYLISVPFFLLISFRWIEEWSKIKVTSFLIIALLLFIQFYVRNIIKNRFIYLSKNERLYFNTIKELAGGQVAAVAPTVHYSYFSDVNQIICNPFMQIAHLSNHSVVRQRFEDLIKVYMNPSQEVIRRYNISLIVIGPWEKEFVKKYEFKLFNFSNSSAFRLVHSSTNLNIFEVKNIEHLPMFTHPNLNYTFYSRWWIVV